MLFSKFSIMHIHGCLKHSICLIRPDDCVFSLRKSLSMFEKRCVYFMAHVYDKFRYENFPSYVSFCAVKVLPV